MQVTPSESRTACTSAKLQGGSNRIGGAWQLRPGCIEGVTPNVASAQPGELFITLRPVDLLIISTDQLR